MLHTLTVAVVLTALASGGAQVTAPSPSPHAPPAARPPLCSLQAMSLLTDGEDGAFNGMSHSGALVILRNLGPSACTVPALPQLTFAAGEHALPAHAQLPGSRFMHPGPVVLPVVLPPNAEATSTLRWVSGSVFEHSVCLHSARLQLAFNGKTRSTPLTATLCGNSAQGVSFERTRFVPDAVWDAR